MAMNPKLKETIRLFVIYGAALALVNALVYAILFGFSFEPIGHNLFNSTGMNTISRLVGSIIGFGFGGFVFYQFFDPVHNWIKGNAFLSRYIHDIYSLFWKPYVLGSIVSLTMNILGGAGALGALYLIFLSFRQPIDIGSVSFVMVFLVIRALIAFFASLIAYYWYAKAISAKLSALYPW